MTASKLESASLSRSDQTLGEAPAATPSTPMTRPADFSGAAIVAPNPAGTFAGRPAQAS